MEKFMQRENAHLGPSSDGMDFNDVFGGPPRRFSMQEVRARYSFSEPAESEEENASSPWGTLKDKPVFGEEIAPRRRHHRADDFFDDIFKGGEPYNSPRRTDRDRDGVFGSNPGSRNMSPANPLPPESDPFGTSLPTHFSLPAKLTKAMETPTFGSHNHGQCSPHLNSSSPLSRFSNTAFRDHDEAHQAPRHSQLSHESSFTSEHSPSPEYSNKDTTSIDDVVHDFHFSIYKWAGRGVPMLTPLVLGSNLRSKDVRNYDKSASTNGRIERKEDRETVKISLEESNVRERTQKEAPMKKKESLKSQLEKPLHAHRDDWELPGSFREMKEKKTTTPEVGNNADAREPENVKVKEGTGIDSNKAKVEKSSLEGFAKNLGANQGKSVPMVKVKEFVQIFNHEADSRPKSNGVQRSRSCRCRNDDANGLKENKVSSNSPKAKEQVNLHNVSFKVYENLDRDEANNPQKTFSSETFHTASEGPGESLDDPLEDNFLVQEISSYDGQENATQSEISKTEDMKAIDAKISQWSYGKKGNIRSLLSTLQYVLWPESGWKAVPLVDMIEANAVKRAYQKALLRLHPDKLQQKGAAFPQKYTAEKVFDILQEAWDHFNTCSITA